MDEFKKNNNKKLALFPVKHCVLEPEVIMIQNSAKSESYSFVWVGGWWKIHVYKHI